MNADDPALASAKTADAPPTALGLPGRVARYWNGTIRACLVVFGGLLTLQSSDRLDPIKLAYLVIAGIAVAGAVVAVWRSRNEPATIAMRPWLIASIVILGLVALSLPVALLNGATPTNWVRDAAAYVLLLATPWIAIDLARSASPRLIIGVGILAGLLGVVSYVEEWVQRRHLADLPFDRLTLPSMALGAGAYCLAVACAVRSRGWSRVAWTLLSMGIIAAFLATGSRTSFALLAGPVAVVFLDAWQRGRVGLRAGVIPFLAQVAAVSIVLLLALGTAPARPTSPSIDPGGSPGPAGPTGPDLEDRFLTIDDVATGRDESLRLRLQQTGIAWDVFLSSPVVGVGLGHEFSFKPTSTTEIRILTMDTPMSVLAKFGILSFLLMGVLAAAFVLVIKADIRRSGTGRAVLALLGFGAVLVALIPFGWPPEDKGTSFALVFLLGLVAADWIPSARENA